MNPNLDFLRSVAVLCVFLAHLYDIFTRTHTDLSFRIGQLGVIMFFVHTSLVLMLALDRSKLTGKRLFKEFYLHRLFRLYPLSIVCVVLAWLTPNSSWTTVELISNLTLTQNLTYSASMVGGLWTLPLEVQMYVMLPFLFIWLRGRPVYWVFGVWLLSLPFAIVQPMITGRFSVIAYIPCFLGGVIAWRMMGRKMLPGWLWLFAVAIIPVLWVGSEGNNMYPRWAFCLVLGLAIPMFREMPWRSLNSMSKLIAKYSYGVYLSHIATMTIAFRVLDDQPVFIQAAVCVVLATVLPLMSYHLIEHPMIRLGKTITNKIYSQEVKGKNNSGIIISS
jgi:peptidoglycan/LPS O-acetylase OafA/YrhL